jgi:hypothetical protein
VRELIPVSLLGMNADLACQYIEFCAYRLLVTLKQPRMYQVANPVPWMTSISLYCKTNSKNVSVNTPKLVLVSKLSTNAASRLISNPGDPTQNKTHDPFDFDFDPFIFNPPSPFSRSLQLVFYYSYVFCLSLVSLSERAPVAHFGR